MKSAKMAVSVILSIVFFPLLLVGLFFPFSILKKKPAKAGKRAKAGRKK